MSVTTFLDAPCGPWCDETGEDGDPRPGRDTPTWRDWLKDIPVALLAKNEGFDGKRPNCDAGWSYYVHSALREHGVTMAEVMRAVFDAGRTQPYRLHGPEYGFREALASFAAWASAQGRAEVAAMAEAAARNRSKRGPPVSVQAFELARAAVADFALLEDDHLQPRRTSFRAEHPSRVKAYLDEVGLDTWKRTDLWA